VCVCVCRFLNADADISSFYIYERLVACLMKLVCITWTYALVRERLCVEMKRPRGRSGPCPPVMDTNGPGQASVEQGVGGWVVLSV